MDQHKDVTIGEHRYRIGVVPADAGSWLQFQLMSHLLAVMAEQQDKPAPKALSVDALPEAPPDPEEVTAGMCQVMLMRLNFEQYKQIQKIVLLEVYRWVRTNEVEQTFPVIRFDGAFALADLEKDSTTVAALTNRALAFTLRPLFGAGGAPKLG